jgi:hypothetical protein
MTRSTRETLQAIDAMGLRERFSAREPDSIASVLNAIIESKAATAAEQGPDKPNG